METNEELDKLLLEIGNIDDVGIQKKSDLRDDDTFARELANSLCVSHGNNEPTSDQNKYTNIQIDKKNGEKSMVRDDALDSSDDEDIKNFLEQKYNEYGRDVQAKLKRQNEEKTDRIITNDVERSINTTTKPKSLGPHEFPKYNPKPVAIQKSENVGIYTDPIFGIRIIHPLISSSQIQERMQGRLPVPMCSIRRHLDHGDLSKDWATAGVIVKKSAINTSKKGSQYVIWTLSDLRGEIKTISLFLFKNAYKEMWKTAQGEFIRLPRKFEIFLSCSDPQTFFFIFTDFWS